MGNSFFIFFKWLYGPKNASICFHNIPTDAELQHLGGLFSKTKIYIFIFLSFKIIHTGWVGTEVVIIRELTQATITWSWGWSRQWQ